MARDYTKYNVEDLGENLNKRQLVFTIVKDRVEKNNPSFEELQQAFPDEVQGSKGFIRKESEVKDPKRFNMREPISIKNGVQIVVSNQWGVKNVGGFILLAQNLDYEISSNDNKTTGDSNTTSADSSGFSEEEITAINDADSGYLWNMALSKALNKERLDALDLEPILIEMAEEETFQDEPFNLPLFELVSNINEKFGNLCQRASYGEDGITKTATEYAVTWGELLETLSYRAETATDYINLASSIQMQFAPFEDRTEAESFASMHYENAIERMDSVQELVDLIGGHLQGEYFEDEDLVTKAGETALELATTFQDYAYICFDDNENCRFCDTDIYDQACENAVELKEQASEDELEGFKELLEEYESEEVLAKL